MKMKFALIAAAATIMGAAFGPATASATTVLTDGDFAGVGLTTGQYTYPGQNVYPAGPPYPYPGYVYTASATPVPNGWTYGGGSLVNGQGSSPWYTTGPVGNIGKNFAGIQSLSTLSQTFTASAGTMVLDWQDAGRSINGAMGNQTYQVLLGSTVEGTFGTASNMIFAGHQLTLSGLTAGNSYTLQFAGQDRADQTAFLDHVTLSAVPEPATWAMMLLGFFGLGTMVRGARRRNLAAAATA